MGTQNRLFDLFLYAITPDEKAVAYAIAAHEPIRNHLMQDPAFKEYVVGTFLYGSYKRHTAVGAIKDVDIVALTTLDIRDEDNTPRKVLRRLKQALTTYYHDPENPAYQRRSIRVNDPLPEHKETTMTLDIIPAVAVSHPDGELWIPDRETRTWIRSHPKGHVEYCARLNAEASSHGRFVPLVRMMKWWWRYQCTHLLPDEERPKPKGFWIECLVAETFDPRQETWAEQFVTVLSNIHAKYANATCVPELRDPGLPHQTIKTRMTLHQFTIFLAAVEASLLSARAALQEVDPVDSALLWRTVFGEQFPFCEQKPEPRVPLGDITHMQPLPWKVRPQYRVTLAAHVCIELGSNRIPLAG